MNITTKSGPGTYKLIRTEVYDHIIVMLQDFHERNGNPLLPLLIELAESSEAIEIDADND